MKTPVDQLIRALVHEGPVIYLDSQSSDHPSSKVSYIAAKPIATIRARGNGILIEKNSERVSYQDNPWKALREFQQESGDWMFGYLGYDLKNFTENLSSNNPDPIQAPDLYFMVPGLLLRIEHDREVHSIKGNVTGITSKRSAVKKPLQLDKLTPTVSYGSYLKCIREAQRRISEGSFYEINLSHQMQSTCRGDTYELYRKMRTVGPVPFGAYMVFDDLSVCCLSPERFLGRDGSRVFSQPIKGTTQRGGTEAEDAVLKEELRHSAKDRAENLMIVDLVRNDLSRIAKKGTVRVRDLFDIQTFGTVHQMISTVEAETEIENPIDIIKACYPMGSMTGAPKISAMKSIEELENYRRGIYSGAIGYFSPNGNFDFNVVIRTAIVRNESLFYSVGGAITGDSDPLAEWEETLIKARALTQALK